MKNCCELRKDTLREMAPVAINGGGIVFAAIADANEFIAACCLAPVMESVINNLISTNSIDFTIDHKKALSSTGSTKGYGFFRE